MIYRNTKYDFIQKKTQKALNEAVTDVTRRRCMQRLYQRDVITSTFFYHHRNIIGCSTLKYKIEGDMRSRATSSCSYYSLFSPITSVTNMVEIHI